MTYLRSTVESQEAKDEDESSKSRQRHRVAGHVYGLALLAEPAISTIILCLVSLGQSSTCPSWPP